MQYTENYNLYKPVYGEPADVADLNHNADEIDSLIHDNRTMIAPAFDTAQAYVIGDPVEYQGKLYVFTDDKAAGAWDSSKVEQTTAAEIGGGGASALDDLTDVDLTTPADGEVLMYDSASGKWENATLPTPTVPDELNDLDDVTITTPTNGQILVYDDTDDEWKNADIPDPSVTAEATGNPITLTDGPDAPMVECKVAFAPKQDLHGYDKPWVGGAGKNKLPMTVDGLKAINSGTWSGNSITINGVAFTILTDSGNNVTGIRVNGTASTTTYFYLSTDFNTTAFAGYLINGVQSGTRFRIMSQSTTDAVQDITSLSDTTIEDNGTSLRLAIRLASSYSSDVTVLPMVRASTESDPTFAPYSNICPITGMDEVDVTVADAETDPTVENTYTIQLGDTYYSGTVDAVRGVLRITSAQIDLGDYNYSYTADRAYFSSPTFSNMKTSSETDVCKIICDSFAFGGFAYDVAMGVKPNGTIWVKNTKVIRFKDNRYTVGTDFKTAVTGVKLVYELETPIEIPLTPTSLRTLSGNNFIWTDADSMDIEYITKPYEPLIEATDISIDEHGKTIESIITENLEPLMVASRNYTIGELIISGDKAYRATANIASGATLTVGTNVESTTVEEEIGRSGHVYSTSEQAVGTWVDGSTLYEKSYHVSTVTSTYVIVDSTITCINAKIRNCSMGTITVGGAYNDAQYVDGRMSQSQFVRVILITGGLTVGMENPPSYPITDFDFTIQYTKSSS